MLYKRKSALFYLITVGGNIISTDVPSILPCVEIFCVPDALNNFFSAIQDSSTLAQKNGFDNKKIHNKHTQILTDNIFIRKIILSQLINPDQRKTYSLRHLSHLYSPKSYFPSTPRDVIPVFTLIHVSHMLNARVRSVMTSPISTQNAIPIGSFLTNNTCCLRICTRSSMINVTHVAHWFSLQNLNLSTNSEFKTVLDIKLSIISRFGE